MHSPKAFAQTRFTEYKFEGAIANSPIVLIFEEPDHFFNNIQGSYYYTKFKKKISFSGPEGQFDGRLKLIESVDDKNTGYFIFENLDYTKDKVVGKWFTMDGKKSFDVILNKVK